MGCGLAWTPAWGASHANCSHSSRVRVRTNIALVNHVLLAFNASWGVVLMCLHPHFAAHGVMQCGDIRPCITPLTHATCCTCAGDIVRVLPGERFPVDGELIDGRCGADESMLTGESLPVPKASGDIVCAGTVCYEGAVTIKATSTGQDSRLAGIGRLVADAQVCPGRAIPCLEPSGG